VKPKIARINQKQQQNFDLYCTRLPTTLLAYITHLTGFARISGSIESQACSCGWGACRCPICPLWRR